MKNIIRKGITRQYYYFRNWGYYYGASELSYKKIKIPISNELFII